MRRDETVTGRVTKNDLGAEEVGQGDLGWSYGASRESALGFARFSSLP
jgi:hypothetical protein